MRSPMPHRLVLAAIIAFVSVVAAPAAAQSVTIIETSQRYPTIQAALDAAKPGQTVEIGSGTYRERLTVRKTLALIGKDTGSGRPLIDGTTGATRLAARPPMRQGVPIGPFTIPRGGAIVVEANGVRIESITVTTRTEPRGSVDYFSSIAEEGCIVLAANGAMVRDTVLERCEKGIVIVGGRDNTVAGNTIRSNYIEGVYVVNASANRIIDNLIEDNTLGGIALATITMPQYMRGREPPMVENNEVARNRVRRNGVGGIGLGLARRNVIIDNDVEDNGGTTIRADAGSQLITADQRGFGISVTCLAYENRVENNRVRRNDDNGILVHMAERNEFVRNEVESSVFGIQSFGALANVYRDNRVFKNSRYGIVFPSARKNEWPSADNLLVGNDLVDNAINAFDATGVQFTPPPYVRNMAEAARREQLAKYGRVNRWDDGVRGNHYSDFDEIPEGFVDKDANGIGEAAHPIPGGAAVDRFPLATVAKTGAVPSTPLPAKSKTPVPRQTKLACCEFCR